MVSRRSMFVVASAYTLTGVFGYFTFLSYTEDDLLKNFKVKGTYISFIMNLKVTFLMDSQNLKF